MFVVKPVDYLLPVPSVGSIQFGNFNGVLQGENESISCFSIPTYKFSLVEYLIEKYSMDTFFTTEELGNDYICLT